MTAAEMAVDLMHRGTEGLAQSLYVNTHLAASFNDSLSAAAAAASASAAAAAAAAAAATGSSGVGSSVGRRPGSDAAAAADLAVDSDSGGAADQIRNRSLLIRA